MNPILYSTLIPPTLLQAPTSPAQPISVGNDFVTPDGMLVPRTLGEAALLGRTAVLIGGLLVGFWPQS